MTQRPLAEILSWEQGQAIKKILESKAEKEEKLKRLKEYLQSQKDSLNKKGIDSTYLYYYFEYMFFM